MPEMKRVRVLKSVDVSDDGIHARRITAGTEDAVEVSLVAGLTAEGYVEPLSSEKKTPAPEPAQEPPAQEPPAQEPPAQEPPAQEPPAQEPPAQEPPAQEPASGAAELLAALEAAPSIDFSRFKAEAAKILGAEKTPAKKADIVAALQAVVGAAA